MPPPPPRVRPGRPDPQGAHFDGQGVNFALYSEHATAVDLCLFDATGRETRLRLPSRTLNVWHGYVEGVGPGQRYGYRVHGPYAPALGHRFNPSKLLVDPYAHQLDGKVDYRAPVYGYARRGQGEVEPDEPDDEDDAWGVPKSVVVDGSFAWGADAPPSIDWRDTVIYELHVKGITKLHPDVPPELRGSYLGLASDPVLAHLRALGVTAVELLPVHECLDEPAVAARNLTNYWGYNPIAFSAPDQRFATRPGAQVHEFKEMVKRLHAAGFEVLIDVVYNHTAEGGELGPTVSLRGVDNAVYYHLAPEDPSRYVDYTGCGNSVCVAHPQGLKLVMDSLRYWVTEMHVDGFRFDLAPTLARMGKKRLSRIGGLFDVIYQDPVLSRVKLIAEPWDLGPDGHRTGTFPPLFSEWNDRFRDTVRRFWIGDRQVLGDLGFRLTGSSDLFGGDGRSPRASINYVTAHDGFTLRDLVSYDRKHNEANGEGNLDGADDNASWNCGVEGETTDPAVLALRMRQRRNLLATLVLSSGVPMLLMGDEVGRTQRGNNNAYCQDNETSWLSWDWDDEQREWLAFVRMLLALRRDHPVFRRREFFRGELSPGRRDIVWCRPDGGEMTPEDWSAPTKAALTVVLIGDASPAAEGAETEQDDTFALLLNAERTPVTFRVPAPSPFVSADVSPGDMPRRDPAEQGRGASERRRRWELVFRSGFGAGPNGDVRPFDLVTLESNESMLLLCRTERMS